MNNQCIVEAFLYPKSGKAEEILTFLKGRGFEVFAGLGGHKTSLIFDKKGEVIQISAYFPNYNLAKKFVDSDEWNSICKHLKENSSSQCKCEIFDIVCEDVA